MFKGKISAQDGDLLYDEGIPQLVEIGLAMTFARTKAKAQFLLLLLLSVWAVADEPAASKPDDPLWTWRVAREQFHEVGKLIQTRQIEHADVLLGKLAEELPNPYGARAAEVRGKLRKTFHRPAARGEPATVEDNNPFDDSEEVLDFSYWDSMLGGYYQLSGIAAVCADLECYSEAVEFASQAIKGNPSDHYGVRHHLARYLEQTRRSPGFTELARLQELLARADSERRRIELHEKVADELLALKDTRGFEAWEEKRLREFGSDPEVQKKIYLAREKRCREAGDEAAARQWESRILREFPEDTEFHVTFYSSRASDAFYDCAYAKAWADFETLISRFPGHENRAWWFQQGAESLKKLARYDDAIDLLNKLDALRPEPKGGNTEAPLLSECYEAKGDYLQALNHALVTKGFSSGGGCLNCMIAARDRKNLRIARLMLTVGRTDEAILLLEDILESGSGYDYPAGELIVRHFHSQGKLDELEARLQKLQAAADEKGRAKYAEAKLDPPAEGFPIAGVGLAREYAAILRLKDRRDAVSLFKKLDELTAESYAAAFYFYNDDFNARDESEWELRHVVEALESLKADARPALLPWLHKSGRLQGWAMVLLAKQGAGEVMEKIRGQLAEDRKTPKKYNGHDGREELRCDFVYALTLLNTKQASNLFEELCTDPDRHWSAAAEDVKELLTRPPRDDEEE